MIGSVGVPGGMAIGAGISSLSLVRSDDLGDTQTVESEMKQTHHSATSAGEHPD